MYTNESLKYNNGISSVLFYFRYLKQCKSGIAYVFIFAGKAGVKVDDE